MSKIVRKIIAILIILAIIYANLAGTAFGIISYALETNINSINNNVINQNIIDNTMQNQNIINNTTQDEIVDNIPSEEVKEEILTIATSEFFKNTMQELETEYENKMVN